MNVKHPVKRMLTKACSKMSHYLSHWHVCISSCTKLLSLLKTPRQSSSQLGIKCFLKRIFGRELCRVMFQPAGTQPMWCSSFQLSIAPRWIQWPLIATWLSGAMNSMIGNGNSQINFMRYLTWVTVLTHAFATPDQILLIGIQGCDIFFLSRRHDT